MAKLHIDIQGQAGVIEELTKEDISTLASCVDKVDDESDVRGRVHADMAYVQDVQKVRERFPNLELNVDVAGIHFEDPEVERILLASTAINPNKDELITFEEAESVTGISIDMFRGKSIVSFDEFEQFVNVTSIPQAWSPERGGFQGCSSLKSISLPPHLATIGLFAFQSCSNLESFNYNPSSIISIGNQAFAYCSKLTMDINFPNLTSLGQGPFYGMKCKRVLSLGKVTNLPCIQGPGAGIFQGNTNLEYMHLPATLTRIEEQGFRSCSKLKIIVCDASVPPTFTSWMGYDGLSGLKYVFVPSGSIENSTDDDGNTVQGYKSKWGFASSKTYAIGGTEWQNTAQEEAEKESITPDVLLSHPHVFENIYGLKGIDGRTFFKDYEVGRVLKAKGVIANEDGYTYEEHNNVKSLPAMTGMDCTYFDIDVFPNVKSIESWRFENAKFQFVKANFLTNVGEYGFYKCANLKTIVLTNVTLLGLSSLAGCNSLERVILGANSVSKNAINNSYGVVPVTDGIYVPDDRVEAYKTDTSLGWTSWASKIKPISSLTPEQKAEYGIE